MGQKTNNLHAFTIDKDNIKEGLISLFDMDEDYNGGNGDEYWEFSDQEDEHGNPISLAVLEGFETEAERFVDGIYFDIVNGAEGGEIGEDVHGNKYEILWGNDKPFKSGDMAYNPMSDIVMKVYFDENDECADDECYVQENYAQVISAFNKNEEPSAHKMITSTLYKVEECHGSHSEQFNFVIVETDFQFVIAVSYLT